MWDHAKLGMPADFSRFAATYVTAPSPFWMKPSAGAEISKMPPLTCWLVIERADETYTLIVPLPSELECHYLVWRDGALSIYAENGEPMNTVAGGLCAYVSHGACLDALLEEGAAAVSKRLPSAKLRRNKKIPSFSDKFGWCTWNAFYGEVSHEKVWQGLEALKAAGVPPRMMILDDGWQQTEPAATGGKMLAGFGANEKFPGGLRATIDMAKGEFGIEDFLVWHAVSGYWRGVSPEKLPQYKPKITPVVFGRYSNTQAIFEWCDGFFSYVPVKKQWELFNDYHTALVAEGVDGVKVDNQASLVYLGAGNGGRTPLLKSMRDALNRSVAKHFGGNLISCMAHAPEIWYNAKLNNLSRGSDDFFPNLPESHGMHIYTNAMTGCWFGQFMWLDWDMFESTNPFGPYHAAGRAVSGSPVYVADKPGEHDAALLRKLVFSDGSVARCDAPGRPTPDCMFHDLASEHMALKVYGTTDAGAVMGLFDVETDKETLVVSSVSPQDVPGLKGSRFAVWMHEGRRCHVMNRTDRLVVILGPRKFDVASIVPVRFGCIAVIGLVGMYNAPASVVEVKRGSSEGDIAITLRDGGRFAAWTKTQPESVRVDGARVKFEWKDGTLDVDVTAKGRCEILIKLS